MLEERSGARCGRSLTAARPGRCCADNGLGLWPADRGRRVAPAVAKLKEQQASGWGRWSGLDRASFASENEPGSCDNG